jgi:hypothetical protein
MNPMQTSLPVLAAGLTHDEREEVMARPAIPVAVVPMNLLHIASIRL